MDEKRFDEILKQRLEAFQDKSPVPENLADQLLDKLPVRKKGIAGGWSSKPWLVAAAMGLILMSMAAVMSVLYLQHESIEKLESEVAEIRRKDSIYIQPIESENESETAVTTDDPVSTPVQSSNPTPGTQLSGPLTNNTVHVSPPAPKISTGTVSNDRQAQLKVKKSMTPIADSSKLVGTIENLINPFSLKSNILVSSQKLNGRSPAYIDKTIKHPAVISSQVFRPGFRIGLMAYMAKPRLDEGMANYYLMPGLKIESRMSQQVGISLGISHGYLQYSVRHRAHDRRPSWFNRFPGIPPHDDSHPLTGVDIKSSFFELPVEFRLYKGEIYDPVSLFAGASLSTAIYYSQQFTYKLKNHRDIPVNQPNRQFEIANWSVSAGAQFALGGQQVELSGFYKQSIMPQGIEKRESSQMGISAGIWFQ